jgi:hypothetical protein
MGSTSRLWSSIALSKHYERPSHRLSCMKSML